MGVDNEGNQIVSIAGTFPMSLADGQNVALGSREDPQSKVTDTTPATIVALTKGLVSLLSGTLTASVNNFPSFPSNQRVNSQDGDQVTVGNTTDAASANTLVGLLKSIKASVAGTLATSVNNFPVIQRVNSQDGDQATIGNTGDLASASTLVGLLKSIKISVAGTLTTSVNNFPASQRVTSQDGDQATIGNTSDASTATSVIGLLKAIKGSVAGTLATSVTNWPGSQRVNSQDGDQVAIGSTTDASTVNTVVGLLKAVKGSVAGTLATSVTNWPSSQRVTSQDGDQATIGNMADASTASSVVGLLKAIKASVQGTLSTTAAISNFPATQAVSIADSSDVAFGAKADAQASTDTGTASFLALFKRLLATKLVTPSSDSLAPASVAGIAQLTFDGANFDRIQNQLNFRTELALAARTTTALGPVRANPNHRGVILIVYVQTVSGTGGITIFVNGSDPTSGQLFQVFKSGILTAAGLYCFMVGTGVVKGDAIGGVNTITLASGLGLPGNWYAVVTTGDASSYTYSITSMPLV